MLIGFNFAESGSEASFNVAHRKSEQEAEREQTVPLYAMIT